MVYLDYSLPKIKKGYRVAVHQTSNFHIELDGDQAWVESYLIGHELHPTPADGRHYIHGFDVAKTIKGEIDCTGMVRFLDRFERRDEEWRIAERRALLEMNRYVPSSARFDELNYTRTLGARHPDDPWYAFRGRKALPPNET